MPIWSAFAQDAKQAKYETVYQGGAAFPGFAETELLPPELDSLRRLIGDPTLTGRAAYRRYEPGMIQPTFIHNDAAVADYTCILFLNGPSEAFGGLAFYGDSHQPEYVNGIPAWPVMNCKLMQEYVPMRPNRLVIFSGDEFHSRWPKDPPSDHVRTIKVYFLKRGDSAPSLNLIKG